MTAEPLKPFPCPFCGSPAVCCWDASYSIKTQYWARCTNCCSKGAIRESEEEAITAWNRRAEPIGNSDELWDWLARRIRNVTYGYQKAADGYYYRDGYHDALEWVLSLKKENK